MADTRKRIIKEIAEYLDCGYNCYYNVKSDEIINIPDFSSVSDEDEFREIFEEDLKRIDEGKTDFIKFEVLASFDSFKIMERFTDQLPENQLKLELENALRRKKPFQNFNRFINNSDFRQNWFDFKQNELEKLVEIPLDRGKASA
jgi:hypothetical protein